MKIKHLLVLFAGSLVGPLSAHKIAPQPPEESKVQLAILLDTSGSMNGLIEQTKTQLWKVVNTFIGAKKDGKAPFVEVALYEYGNSRLDHKAQWVRQIQPLTRDLDQVSEDLFGLTTSGGDEFCGAVITRAMADLKWDPSPQVYKAIFIAGNESFTQGPISPQEACREAIAKGVVVNTIHCGREDIGLSGEWNAGQLLAEGSFLVIDHNAAVVHIAAPQDAEIMKWNAAINETYIPFGKAGAAKKEKQVKQDGNSVAKKESGAHVQRALAKASQNYWNGSWDLCDACHAGKVDWTTLKDEDLPKEMRKLDLEGRKKYVADHQAKRTVIQKKIQDLNKARSAFVAGKRKELVVENTLDVAVTKTVRDQAAKKGYQFKQK
ncbi:MAG: vWA domain-containing protein [Akkermansiaceae bacterium]